MLSACSASTTVVEKVKYVCAGSIVTVDLSVDVISDETARSILKNNAGIEAVDECMLAETEGK